MLVKALVHGRNRLCRNGCRRGTGCTPQSDLDSVADEVRALVEKHTFACDVTDEAALTGVVETLTEAWGSLDILINNAGAPGQAMAR